ncbi:hypothetical protein FC16_GL000343 [Loigolactobacillus coryniformis subsp. torquens DSM 20004 = KCTC 3535]|jgi:hypothetical protein|nr:hypothetical protein FC16_GL000343 [Loigolactobacillus coryniformis subsp. torquens DSM 20004 = KCTC 3535]
MMDVSQEQLKIMGKAYQERLAAIEANSRLTILDKVVDYSADSQPVTPYIVYTDFNRAQLNEKSSSIFVYTAYENVDKYGHSKTDYQNELLFEYDAWAKAIHITVLETLGAESQLAFYDFQNHGLAQLSLRYLLKIARANQVVKIDGNVSSFDGESLKKVMALFEKFGFEFKIQNAQQGLASFYLTLAE